jgi:predicted aconitase
MKLTDEEKQMLDGKFGEAARYSLEILVKLGLMYGAEHFVEIESAHVALSYPYFQASIDLAEIFADKGGKFRLPATTNTTHWPSNFNRWPELPESSEYHERCRRLIAAVKKMGGIMTCSCTPYYQGNLPRFGAYCSWTESSAITFANSVCGARANRITDGLDKAAAITGRMPYFGLYLDENRKGNALVKVEFTPKNLTDYGLLGYLVGKYFGDKIPVIEGLPAKTTVNQLKVFGAAAAGSGAVPLYHCVGLTPEARTREQAFGGVKTDLEIKIGPKEIAAAVADLNTAKEERFDAVFLGCPHPDIAEVKNLAALLSGKRVKAGVKFWIFISADVLALARNLGYADLIEETGAEFLERTCAIFFDLKSWGWKTVLTDSPKFANLLPSDPTWLNAILLDTEGCIKAAIV